jgi:endonuclease/exonuclease/phosphatase family metal-dependent hydrolase
MNIQMPDNINWIVVGDFNLCRSPDDRNRPGGDISDMLLFNEAINYLGLVDLPPKGRHFTWTNKQHSPLLECLDWFFTSTSWTLVYPNTFVTPLVMETSDHVPCLIIVSTSIPKQYLFHFENYWLHHNDFYNVVQQARIGPYLSNDAAKNLTAKFKS